MEQQKGCNGGEDGGSFQEPQVRINKVEDALGIQECVSNVTTISNARIIDPKIW